MSKEDIITIIVAFIGSGILNAIISHILYSKKLKKELKSNGNNMIAQEIEKSLLTIRDIELKTKEIEIFDVIERNSNSFSIVNLFGQEEVYLAIYNDMESLKQFHSDIQMCREKYEKNVPIRIALNLVFIDRYIAQSVLFIKNNLEKLTMHEWGALLIFDIQKWQRHFDKILIREINKHKYKLESHETKKWERLRKKVVEHQYNETILKFLVTGEPSRKNMKIAIIINQFMNNLNEKKQVKE